MNASPEMLRRRSEIVRGIRRYFDERGFVEVDTPVAIAAPAPEEHIDCPPLAHPLMALDGRRGEFLRASPELQMKKLLALGMDRIYQLGPCFREGERGSRHNPEFTMLEWYRAGATYQDIARDLEGLFASLHPEAPPPLTLTVREAYLKHAEWDPFVAFDQDRFDYDMALKVEPALKEMGGGVFLTDYPPAAASLARLRGGVAERWEFYFDGMELANCFTELCDGEEQRRRFEKARAARRQLNEADYPIDEDFLGQLDQIGSAAGVALGIDRFVMVLTGANSIAEVRAGE